MRPGARAILALLFLAILLWVTSVLPAGISIKSSPTVRIKASPVSLNVIAPAERTPLLTKESLTPLLVYYGLVLAAQQRQLESQRLAAERQSLIKSTPAPNVSGGDDATSTNTADWNCIRVHESGNRYNDPTAPSGAYGIEPATAAAYGLAWPVSSTSAAQQDAVALELYNKDGWQPWSTRYICNL